MARRLAKLAYKSYDLHHVGMQGIQPLHQYTPTLCRPGASEPPGDRERLPTGSVSCRPHPWRCSLASLPPSVWPLARPALPCNIAQPSVIN